ncbi:PTS lactose/cellobiose transporter subunit IIA [Ligilactobacillus pobuzihii]|uniref:PTS lactose/cellobiose transporter subunit IIA n=1 Tax=Ligilactobacillus acidipiscis TaxID=89059 RepID=A0A921F9G2_9LACO|nr:PTS lactose/cellobiose transporter subunit IIA [Ligilactobacillus pobuzihii]MBN7273915.1 PTS lactose/cellobiose transporter subunit IIA [Ligilactobacillus pobuzihii]HIZ95759.1 PTS lactose/cellobiose transporter subunit IIA [Candidatus Ligilactobacillus excrementavium]HJE97097.1 PTS lactose/cellobiose transporter subunit IIA [Ligilactobacillus acidipiscis]
MAEEEKNSQQSEEEQMQTTMGLIVNAGNAKSFAVEAIKAAKEGDFDKAHDKLDDAQKALVAAHNTQTGMLTKEAQGEHTQVTLLMVHSQDHLMTAITFVDLATNFVDVYEQLDELKK